MELLLIGEVRKWSTDQPTTSATVQQNNLCGTLTSKKPSFTKTHLTTLSSAPVLPVSGDVTHEEDTGVHVEIEGGCAKVAVDQAHGDGVAGVVGDSDGETEAEQEVGGGQVLQVDGHAAGRLLSSAEVNPQGEAVEEQTHLQRKQAEDSDWIWGRQLGG